jgi:hypothetical protein
LVQTLVLARSHGIALATAPTKFFELFDKTRLRVYQVSNCIHTAVSVKNLVEREQNNVFRLKV